MSAYNPYKQLVEKYESLRKVQRNKGEPNGGGAVPKALSQSPPSTAEDDDASSKHTQTDENSVQLFATMANFYRTDTDVIESRFKNRPEYKELFKEIFDTLKIMSTDEQKQPEMATAEHEERFNAVYNMFEELSVDDTQSINSSIMSEPTSILSERITKIERKNIKKAKKAAEKEKSQKGPVVMGLADGRIVTPYNRDPLLDVINITGKKRARHGKKKRDAAAAKQRFSGADSPAPFDVEGLRMIDSPTPSLVEKYRESVGENGVEFKPSSASQNLHKLKKLDLSYAEVLRLADAKPQGKYARRN